MKLNLLLICYFDPLGLLTVQDSVTKLKKLSRSNIHILNLYPNLSFKQSIDLTDFHGIIIHNTVAYNPKTLYTLDKDLSLKNFSGIKILFKQDEHVRSHETARFIGKTNIDLVLTCLPENEINKVYPKKLVGNAKFLSHYTSYISDDLIKLATSNEYLRSTDIGYRGSIQPLQCGVLGYEKWHIGDAIQNKLKNTLFNLDISSKWSSRIHGADWINFLLSSKATLGVESGSNLFDFTGEVESKCNRFERKNVHLKNNFEKLYHKAHAEFLHKYEDNVHYAQISPRHFEAAATKTLQILYEGEYSGIFVPYKHYLPLKRDLSNIEEVIELLSNTKKRRLITDCAFEEIALNPAFQIDPFIQRFDETLDQIAAEKKLSKNVPQPSKSLGKKNIIILVPHELHLDPRIRWLEKGYAKDSNVICIGIIDKPELKKYVIDEQNKNHIHLNLAHIMPLQNVSKVELIAEEHVNLRHQLNQFSNPKQIEYPDNSFYSTDTKARHTWYCKHMSQIDRLFEEAVQEIVDFNHATPDLLIAADLIALLPGVSLSRRYQVPLIYDAHEFWAYSDVALKPWETDFWLRYESTLLKYVDLPVTVSNGIAAQMTRLYQKEFIAVPNAELKSDNLSIQVNKPIAPKKTISFLYQGAFAPGRGLETLIKTWIDIDKSYILMLRGPSNDYLDQLKSLAEKHHLLNNNVYFLAPVKENELVAHATKADIGIIPYDQNISEAYRFCSPNKLSQYMAAGLPIISNKLPEVEQVVAAANCGYSLDFDNKEQLIDIIHQLGKDHHLRQTFSKNARDYFLSTYHWEHQASIIYVQSKALINKHKQTENITHFETSFLSEKSNLDSAIKTSMLDKINVIANDLSQPEVTTKFSYFRSRIRHSVFTRANRINAKVSHFNSRVKHSVFTRVNYFKSSVKHSVLTRVKRLQKKLNERKNA